MWDDDDDNDDDSVLKRAPGQIKDRKIKLDTRYVKRQTHDL